MPTINIWATPETNIRRCEVFSIPLVTPIEVYQHFRLGTFSCYADHGQMRPVIQTIAVGVVDGPRNSQNLAATRECKDVLKYFWLLCYCWFRFFLSPFAKQ